MTIFNNTEKSSSESREILKRDFSSKYYTVKYTPVLSIHTVLYMVTDAHHEDSVELNSHPRFYKYVLVLRLEIRL